MGALEWKLRFSHHYPVRMRQNLSSALVRGINARLSEVLVRFHLRTKVEKTRNLERALPPDQNA
jgi:hypothetical protein